jgi:membrane protease YdiL (CAAX protease family)
VLPGEHKTDLVELCVGYALILGAIWTVNPWQRRFYWTAIAWVVLTTCIHRPKWRALGLGLPGLFPSLWIIGAAAVLAGLAVYIANQMHSLHPLHGPTPLLSHIWGYLIWALMQQFLLQIYFLLRLMRLLRDKLASIAVAALIFSLAHLPNPVLTPVTMVWGIAACVLFLRYRNI